MCVLLSIVCICFNRLRSPSSHWLIFRKSGPSASKSEHSLLFDCPEAFSWTDGFLVNEKWHSCEMLRETDTDWRDEGVWMEAGAEKNVCDSVAARCQCVGIFFLFFFTEQHRQALSGKPCQYRVPFIRISWHGALSPIHHNRYRGWGCWFKSCSRQLLNWLSHSSKDFPHNLFHFLRIITSNSSVSSFKQLFRWRWMNKCCFHLVYTCLWVHSFINVLHCHLLTSACRITQRVCFCSLLSVSDFPYHRVS